MSLGNVEITYVTLLVLFFIRYECLFFICDVFSFSECCLGTVNVVGFPHCVGEFECTVCLVVWAVSIEC